jgi:dihydroorotate dehydrogenase
MLYELLRPWLFKMDPEEAHEKVIGMLETAQKFPGVLNLVAGSPAEGLETEVFGLKFRNPIGLAAGFDKQCKVLPGLAALGFGHVELGSITLRPQSGNDKPRIFRLPEHEAVINRLGFPSEGAEAAAGRLKAAGRQASTVTGINLGINKDCPKDHAPQEYVLTFKRLENFGDYFAVNVSSPNTGGLRELQEKLHLKKILTALQSENKNRKPILVKLSPDLQDTELEDAVYIAQELAQGVIATNTTVSRNMLPSDIGEIRGGLSGAPLRSKSTHMIAKIHKLAPKLPIIGVGGVFTGGDALEKIMAGASLVQIYTGMIYRGPSAAVAIQRELKFLMGRRGFKTIREAVGASSREAVA